MVLSLLQLLFFVQFYFNFIHASNEVFGEIVNNLENKQNEAVIPYGDYISKLQFF